jgi:hypothetical protein
VHSILLHPLHPDQLFVSNQSSTCYLMNMNGQVIKALQSGKRQGGGKGGNVHCSSWVFVTRLWCLSEAWVSTILVDVLAVRRLNAFAPSTLTAPFA